jgi:hypothetical protein
VSGEASLGRAARAEAVLRALEPRVRPGERPEDVLIDHHLVSARDLALELATVTGLPLVGLRDYVPDPTLLLYVPLSIATQERLCPLELIGDVLRLAAASPDADLSYLRSRFPNLQVELVLAPRDEILTALRAAAAAM